MRELKLRYFIDLASNIGAKSRTEAQAVERSQRAMQAAVDKTSGSVRGLDTAFARWGANQAAERQLGYMRRLAVGIDQVTAKTRAMVSVLQNAVPKAVAIGGGAAGAFYAGKTLLDKPMDYSARLAQMANTAYSDRNTAGRLAGKGELDKSIVGAVRFGGGSRDDAAVALDNMIASGVVNIDQAKALLPGLMKNSSASGASAKDLSSISIRASQTMGIPLDQVMDILDEANAAGKAGGFELRDMAKSLPQAMAGAKQSGLTGREGFRKVIAMLQASVITAGSKDEAANNVFNWLGKINSEDTAKDFAKQGIDLRGRLVSGRAKGMDSADTFVSLVDEVASKDKKYTDLKAQLAKAKNKGEKEEALSAMTDILQGSAIGKVIQDRQALMSLVSVMNNREYVAEIQKKMRDGKGSLGLDFDVMSGESSFKAQQLANNRDIAMTDAMGDAGPLKKLLDGANWAAEKFPVLTAGVVGTTAALGVFATALMAFGLLGGRSAGGLPGRGGPGGGLPRSGGSPGAFPKLDGAASSAGGAGAGKMATGLKTLGWIGAGLSLASELFLTSDADIATLNAADARKAAGTNGRGKGFNDPRLLAATMPSIAEQAAAMGGQAQKVELGDGKIAVDVRVTDERTTATASVTTPMSGVKLSTGATKPEGTW
jgi:hypothetical protein